MGDLIRFVDSVVGSPGILLDLNDETTWAVTEFDAPPPPLRRTLATNSLRDGGTVTNSQYDLRVIRLTLEVKTAGQDTNATQLQNLARQLDKRNNLLMYRPTGATKAVWFRTYRSTPETIRYITGSTTLRTIQIDLLADPFAVGERVSAIAGSTVSHNPTSGSSTGFQTASQSSVIQGDVPTRCVIGLHQDSNTGGIAGYYVTTGPGSGQATQFTQGESATKHTDAVNGAGGDGTYSNSNWADINFATTTAMAKRLSFNEPTINGRWRIIVRCKKTSASSVINLKYGYSDGGFGRTVQLNTDSNHRMVDLGVTQTPFRAPIPSWPYNDTDMDVTFANTGELWAERVSGSGSVRIDYIAFVPATESGAFVQSASGWSPGGTTSWWILDGEQDTEFVTTGGSGTIFTNAHTVHPSHDISRLGDYPTLTPGQQYKVHVVHMGGNTAFAVNEVPVGSTILVYLYYWPKYLHVRPSAT